MGEPVDTRGLGAMGRRTPWHDAQRHRGVARVARLEESADGRVRLEGTDHAERADLPADQFIHSGKIGGVDQYATPRGFAHTIGWRVDPGTHFAS